MRVGNAVHLTVRGRPAPQGSKVPVGFGKMREASRFLPAWRAAVTAAALLNRTRLPEGPVCAVMTFRVAKPASAPRWRIWPFKKGSGDIDKLARATLDGITDARVWADDSRVVRLCVQKIYAGLGGHPTGATIDLCVLTDDDSRQLSCGATLPPIGHHHAHTRERAA